MPLRRSLAAHEVATAWQCGWAQLSNGDLLAAAEAAGFDLLITTDQNLRYQQTSLLAGSPSSSSPAPTDPRWSPTPRPSPKQSMRCCPANIASGFRREAGATPRHAAG